MKWSIISPVRVSVVGVGSCILVTCSTRTCPCSATVATASMPIGYRLYRAQHLPPNSSCLLAAIQRLISEALMSSINIRYHIEPTTSIAYHSLLLLRRQSAVFLAFAFLMFLCQLFFTVHGCSQY